MIAARVPDWRIEWYVSLDSTQLEALRLAAQAAPHRTVVLAQEQTAGMGRLGRTWHSEAGAGLYLSCILRLNLPAGQLPAFTVALGLAVKKAIEQVTQIECDLRWPNDVLIGERKVCGILTQFADEAVVAGIGINVSHTEFPPDLAAMATSLRLEGAGTFSREDLFVALLNAVSEYAERYALGDRESILFEFAEQSSYVVGRRVVVEQEGRVVRGHTDGLDENGFLLVRTAEGARVTILAGGVRPDSD
jgi:BirA family transcriptional regulator, biotin operon repressor / biotin---[acetyl-CoA-carboxylase] ligase